MSAPGPRSGTATASSRRRSAPLGIKVLCVPAAIGTLLGLFGGLRLVAAASALSVPGWVGVLGLVVLGLSLVNVPMVYGLWTLKPWGWTLAVVVYGLNALLQGLSLLVGNLGAILGLLISGGILWYVYSKRALYGKM